MVRHFNKKKQGVERDSAGHRTGFPLVIRCRTRMSNEGYDRWGKRLKKHIAKSRYVFKPYSSTRAIGMPEGIPVEVMKDDSVLGAYLIRTFLLAQGEEYSIQGFTGGKTKTHVKFTKTLFTINVLDADCDPPKFQLTGSGSLNRYFFRAKKKSSSGNRAEGF